ncbi:hypothetical protein GCM10027418_22830 [Mariniluteicoccus endophyticus]
MTASPWAVIRDKKSLRGYTRQLQTFTTTDDPPRLKNNRRLPHPMRWEWEAQRHVRCLVQQYQAGDVVLLHLGTEEEIWGVVHIRIKSSGARMTVNFEVMAVAKPMRGSTPPHVGDDLYAHALLVLDDIIPSGTEDVLLVAMVHVENRASERLLKRHGFEPAHAPRTDADYGPWHRPWRTAAKRP